MFKPVRIVAATALAIAISVPAGAEETTTFVPDTHTERTYLVCNGANKVQNQTNPVAWNTTAPTTSYTGGGGCGFADTGFLGNTADNGAADLVATGTYTGNLDKIAVHMHDIDGPFGRSGLGPAKVNLQVEVDGEMIYDSGEDGVDLDITRSSTGATALLELTITDINKLTEADLIEHDVLVRYSTFYSDDVNAWVWGATEIDSGLTFNPAKVAGTRLRALK